MSRCNWENLNLSRLQSGTYTFFSKSWSIKIVFSICRESWTSKFWILIYYFTQMIYSPYLHIIITTYSSIYLYIQQSRPYIISSHFIIISSLHLRTNSCRWRPLVHVLHHQFYCCFKYLFVTVFPIKPNWTERDKEIIPKLASLANRLPSDFTNGRCDH